MNSNKIIMSLLVFICFVEYVIIELKIRRGDNLNANTNITSINTKQLEAQNDSLLKSNKILDAKYQHLQYKTDSIQNNLLQTKQSITQLKTKQYEKVNAIGNLNGNELYDYFSNFKTEDKTGR